MEVKEFLRKYAPRLGTRPEYFSGRGATLSDLNSEILEGIYKGLVKEVSKDAAENFVVLVAKFKCLSATAFLNDFIDWYCSGCNEYQVRDTSDVDLGPDNEGRLAIGLATIGSMMFSSGSDHTNQIREDFILGHRKELKSKGHEYLPIFHCYSNRYQ
jgi:hypothetical protein